MSFAYLSNLFHHFMVSKYSTFCLQGSNNVLFNFLLISFYVILIFSSLCKCHWRNLVATDMWKYAKIKITIYCNTNKYGDTFSKNFYSFFFTYLSFIYFFYAVNIINVSNFIKSYLQILLLIAKYFSTDVM